MLVLKNIYKTYSAAGGEVHALKDINLAFRRNEFVAVLGPSGCGKTTLLNIIGGLDHYTSGDLLIEDVSTKSYTDRDWDTYRNHSIGFIFQSYHLIPHQTILQNVEIALMIAGVDKQERRKRAIEALAKVGLEDKINNRPNQLSGGQMQRVAIARALINDPEIVLADEPTGALDSKTSVQIMDLLKEISKDRLVVMVTHNPELAEQYATRIIRLFDGAVTDDSMPFDFASEQAEETAYKEAEAAAEAAEFASEASEAASEAAGEAPAELLKAVSEAAGEPAGGLQTVADETPTEGGEDGNGAPVVRPKTNKGKKKRSSMSFGMAFGLSLKNLLSKSGRTIMVAVASSIGIIGVSLVLAISAGVTNYIGDMEDDMLSGYPISITETAISYSSLMDAADAANTKVPIEKLQDNVYINSLLESLMSMSSMTTTNIITDDYISYVESMPADYYNAIQFGYDFDMSNYIYTDFELYSSGGADAPTEKVSVTGIRGIYTSVLGTQPDYSAYSSLISTIDTMSEIPDNYEYILSQYDIIATDSGKTQKQLTDDEIRDIFESEDSLIVVLSKNSMSDLNMAQYGFMSEYDFLNYAFMEAGQDGYDEAAANKYLNGVPLNVLTDKTFTWYPNDVIYAEMPQGTGSTAPYYYRAYADGNGPTEDIQVDYQGVYTQTLTPPEYDAFDSSEGMDMHVKAVLQKKSGISYGCLSSGMYYTSALTKKTIETSLESNIVNYVNNTETGYLSSVPYYFNYTYPYTGDDGVTEEISTEAGMSTLLASMNLMSMMSGSMDTSTMMQVTAGMLAGTSLPTSLYIYPVDFDNKDLVTDWLDAWNSACVTPIDTGKATASLAHLSLADSIADTGGNEAEENTGGGTSENGTGGDVTAGGETAGTPFTWTDNEGVVHTAYLTEGDEITYTDSVGLIISLVDTMINMITIALICFTALSLVVSTVMVGVITYVSVVERVKEIGILRAIGARKRDIKSLFNAETFIIGLAAGIVGIVLTYIVSAIVNLAVGLNFGIYTLCALPWWEALIMICVSFILTLISGLIPASAAAKKDPVVALRTE
ncbi:MAG: ABC transporter ATP-binding protein/permease [Clostridia bacterium]|nr:ABC transporter ATP-binding protein/permease [Clostridia bacterium]